MARRMAWMAANALPFAALIALRHPLPPSAVFAAAILVLAGGQALVMRSRRWFVFTALGVTAAFVAAALVLAIADSRGAERLGMGIAHAIGGSLLIAIQSLALAGGRRRWIVTGAAAWIVASTLLATLSPLWHPGGSASLFPGYRELASFTCLAAIAGIATMPRHRRPTPE